MTRRTFLRGSGITLAGVGMTSLLPSALLNHAVAQAGASDKRLLFIFQRGANDGINTVIPHGDVDYNTTHRPNLWIDPADAIDTGNGFASFHPALSDLMDLYNAGQLAAIHRVGYPNQSRSHFDSQRIWENGDPANAQLFEGWLYRYAIEHGVDQGGDLPIFTSQSLPPLVIRGDQKFVNVANPDDFDYPDAPPKRDKYQAAWRRRFAELSGLEPFRPLLSDAGLKLIDVLDEYRSWDQGNWHPTHPNTGDFLFPVDDATNPPDPSGPNGLKFPPSAYDFFKALKVCCLSLLESSGTTNGTRIAGTELTGWDHHSNQGQLQGIHRDLLMQLAYGIESARIALSGQATNEPRGYASIWENTVVVTLTEFGRTTIENGSNGTDHAEACAIFAAGGPVQGGVYNCDATTWGTNNGVMFDVDGRYLSHVSDYRALMWEILRDHMGADPLSVDTIFPGYTSAGLSELGFIV